MNKGLAMLDINLFKHDLANLINTTSDMIVYTALNGWHREQQSTLTDKREYSPM
jgi:hypothetical protein